MIKRIRVPRLAVVFMALTLGTGVCAAAAVVPLPPLDATTWAGAVWAPLAADSQPPDADPDACVAATLHIGGSAIEVVLPTGAAPVPRAAILHWIANAADEITAYYGHYTVANVRIVVEASGDRRIGGGKEYEGRYVHVTLGSATTVADLDTDWVMTHEMVHLSFPDLDERYNWLEEGLATWLEPVLRARRGRLAVPKVWGDLVEGLPKGQPEAGDLGMDNTPTWGRTYWGGCGYWLLADLGIREKTRGAKSLDDVLRAVNATGADGGTMWTLEKLFQVAKAATGTDVLEDLHERLGQRPQSIELAGLWKRLGVAVDADGVHLDDRAPEAEFRKAITMAQ